MDLADFTSHDALGLAELVRNRDVSPKGRFSSAFGACAAVNPAIRAVIESSPQDIVPIGREAGEGLNGHGIGLAVGRGVRDSAAFLDCVQGAENGDPYVVAPPAPETAG